MSDVNELEGKLRFWKDEARRWEAACQDNGRALKVEQELTVFLEDKVSKQAERVCLLEEELKRAADWLTNAASLLKAYGDMPAWSQMMYSAKLARREVTRQDTNILDPANHSKPVQKANAKFQAAMVERDEAAQNENARLREKLAEISNYTDPSELSHRDAYETWEGVWANVNQFLKGTRQDTDDKRAGRAVLRAPETDESSPRAGATLQPTGQGETPSVPVSTPVQDKQELERVAPVSGRGDVGVATLNPPDQSSPTVQEDSNKVEGFHFNHLRLGIRCACEQCQPELYKQSAQANEAEKCARDLAKHDPSRGTDDTVFELVDPRPCFDHGTDFDPEVSVTCPQCHPKPSKRFPDQVRVVQCWDKGRGITWMDFPDCPEPYRELLMEATRKPMQQSGEDTK